MVVCVHGFESKLETNHLNACLFIVCTKAYIYIVA